MAITNKFNPFKLYIIIYHFLQRILFLLHICKKRIVISASVKHLCIEKPLLNFTGVRNQAILLLSETLSPHTLTNYPWILVPRTLLVIVISVDLNHQTASASSSKDKAQLFNDCFTSCFFSSNPLSSRSIFHVTNPIFGPHSPIL